MPVTKLNSLNSEGHSQSTSGPNGMASAAVGEGSSNDFNDANILLQRSLGLAVSTTQDMGRGHPKLTINNSNPVHSQENVNDISLD